MSWIDVNGVSIYYQLEGPDDGLLVALVHEIGGTAQSFDRVIPHLTERFRVLSFDQRGAGQSEKVVGPISIDDLVGDISGLIDAVGGSARCSFVTVAAAGLQALKFYQEFPDRVGSMVLCNPALGVDPERTQALLDRAQFVESNGIRAGLEAMIEKSYPVELRDDIVFPAYRGRYLANDPHGFAESNRVLANTDLRDLIPKIKCPTMVVAGRYDQVRPAKGSEEVASQIESSRFEVLDGGHFLPTTAPDQLGKLLVEFLTENS
jgi:3-oxoadipate enol-lactonase